MAKGKQPTGLKATTTVRRAMKMVLPPQVRAILGYEVGVRARDPESVHDMRVATKRLREAARVFRPAFGKARMARHLWHLETLNNALGEVRQLDVMGEQLAELAERDVSLAEGLRPLCEKLGRDREDADSRLTPVLDETLPHLKQDFIELLQDRRRKSCKVWQEPLIELARESLTARLADVEALEPAAREPGAVAEFHRLRIAVKKVKYALELFLDAIGKRAEKAYRPTSQLQELMGKVHDCDVLLRVIEEAKGGLVTATVADRAKALIAGDREALRGQTLQLLDKMRAREVFARLLRKLKRMS